MHTTFHRNPVVNEEDDSVADEEELTQWVMKKT